MTSLTDKYGRTITITPSGSNNTYSTNGISVSFPIGTPDSSVIAAFNGMAPANWVPPLDRERMIVSPFQAKAALLQAGLLDQVTALINDPTTDPVIPLAWNNVTEFKRTSTMIASLASKLNLSDTQLDNLFTAAAKITA